MLLLLPMLLLLEQQKILCTTPCALCCGVACCHDSGMWVLSVTVSCGLTISVMWSCGVVALLAQQSTIHCQEIPNAKESWSDANFCIRLLICLHLPWSQVLFYAVESDSLPAIACSTRLPRLHVVCWVPIEKTG